MKQQKSVLIGIALILIAFASSCKNDNNPAAPQNPSNPSPTTYAGTFAGATESGALQLTVAGSSLTPRVRSTDAIVAVSGWLKTVLGDSVALAGTFNTANDSLLVTGGTYSFAGVLAGGNLSGVYTGPHGSGVFTLQTSTGGNVKVYVGTYTSQSGGSNGKFNIVVKAGTLTGLAVSATGSDTPLKGTVVVDSISVFVPGSTSVLLAHGSFTDTAHVAAAGVYDDHSGDYGIWSCAQSH